MQDYNPIRTEIAKRILEQMVANPIYWMEAYCDRPMEMSEMEPEQYAAKVSVRYADALIKELDNIESPWHGGI
jgi:hypothetical protein